MFKLRIPLVLPLLVLFGLETIGSSEEIQTFSVQVGAFAKRQNAEGMAAALKLQGYTPYIFETTDHKGRHWSLVRIGDYTRLEEARAAVREYEAKQKEPALITHRDSRSAVRPLTETPAAAPDETLGVQTTLPAAGTAGIASATDEEPDIKELEEQLETLQTEVEELRKEAKARKRLEITEEEKSEKEKEILTAAGRQYTLLPRYTLGLEYNLRYMYYSYDVIQQATTVEQIANHTIENDLFTEFALLNNLTFNLDVSFVYKFDESGTGDNKDVTDLGDLSLGLRYQPFKTGGKIPTLITFFDYVFDTGRSPYEINPQTELATGKGYPTASLGISLSRSIDPIVAFGTVSYTFSFSVDDLSQKRPGDVVLSKVEPGDSVGLNIGFGYAMSYKVSLNFSYQYVYRFEDRFFWENTDETTTGSRTFSILSIGTGWQLSPTLSIIMRVGIGLTNDDPDFIFSLRTPFQFKLGG